MADILITGATGFVGSHFVEALARRRIGARAIVRPSSNVSVLDRHGVAKVVADLGDVEALRRAVAGAHTVVHLAAATRALRGGTFHDVNAAGTARLIDAMTQNGGERRLVYLSSLAAVGPARERAVHPDDEPLPLTSYGRSKLEGERRILGRQDVSGLVLRAPAVYGPGDRDLLTFFRLARRGVLPVIGRPDRRIQMVHVADLAHALVLAVENPSATGVLHIAEERAYTWTELLDQVAQAVGRQGVRVRVPAAVLGGAAGITQMATRLTGRPAIFDREKALEILADGWLCETDSARRTLGFVASIPLAEGLRATAAWYRAHGWL